MRIANVNGRLALLDADYAIDIEKASEGRFSADPQAVFARWAEFCAWAPTAQTAARKPFDKTRLGAPVPRPAQVFGIGLNYRDHAAEVNSAIPDYPVVFTKFPSSITGPNAAVSLPSDQVDYEVELVVAIGEHAHKVSMDAAWSHVAGVTVGQDLSDREVQLRGTAPQFSLGKSFPGFAPIGPTLVTPDEFESIDALDIGCRIGGKVLQQSNTKELIFSIPELIAQLTAVVMLLPGDLVFTGTPAGVGAARNPARYLRSGEVLTSYISGIGEMHTTFS